MLNIYVMKMPLKEATFASQILLRCILTSDMGFPLLQSNILVQSEIQLISGQRLLCALIPLCKKKDPSGGDLRSHVFCP